MIMSILKDPIKRRALLCLLLGLAAVAFLINTRAAFAVGIKQSTVITGDVITLGDVFYNLPEGGDTVLGPAPQPGNEMVLNARTLLRIALAMDLPWRPQTSAEQVVLSRAATVIDEAAVTESLRKSLEQKGVEGSFNLLYNGVPPKIVLPPDMKADFEISNVVYNPQGERFSAIVFAPSASNPIKRLEVSGGVERMVMLPVPRDNIRNGIIIGKRDIDVIEVRQRDLNADFITNAEELTGMTPRRMLLAGKPVRASEIEAPRIVGRGESVTMIFKEGALVLTAKGKALENGAKGDLIRVVNDSSKRTIEAVVTAENEVTVQSY